MVDLCQLPGDVLLEVLCLCDVRDILAIEQTCYYLAGLVSTRRVWSSVVSSLGRDSAPDLPPTRSLASMGARELRDLVARATRLERNWTSAEGPRPTREIKLRPATLTAEQDSHFLLYSAQARLLPGGEYLLYLNTTKLECWRVATHETVWKQTTDWNTYDFDFEVVNEGKDVRVALAIRVTAPPTNLLQVISLHLESGAPTLIATRILPEVERSTALYRIKIQGSSVVASIPDLEAFRGQLLVMNWESRTCLYLIGDLQTIHMGGHCLTTRHILFIHPVLETFHLAGVRLSKLAGLGSASDHHHDWPSYDVDALDPITTPLVGLPHDRLMFTPDLPWEARISALVTSWKRVPSTSVSVLFNIKAEEAEECSVSFYRMQVLPPSASGDRDECFEMEAPIKVDAVPFPHVRTALSVAGRAVAMCYKRMRYCALSPSVLEHKNKDFGHIQLDDALDHISIEPFSGALSYSTFSGVVIKYYD